MTPRGGSGPAEADTDGLCGCQSEAEDDMVTSHTLLPQPCERLGGAASTVLESDVTVANSRGCHNAAVALIYLVYLAVHVMKLGSRRLTMMHC